MLEFHESIWHLNGPKKLIFAFIWNMHKGPYILRCYKIGSTTWKLPKVFRKKIYFDFCRVFNISVKLLELKINCIFFFLNLQLKKSCIWLCTKCSLFSYILMLRLHITLEGMLIPPLGLIIIFCKLFNTEMNFSEATISNYHVSYLHFHRLLSLTL